MVDRSELACYEYINSIRDIQELQGMSLYNLDKFRTELHDELCKLFGLTKERTLKYTSNIDINMPKCAEKLYIDLLHESRKEPDHD